MRLESTATPPRSRRCACGGRHRKWSTIAKCRWPRNIWIVGDGRWATVAHCVSRRADEPYFGRAYCDSQTVALHQTREDAEIVLGWIAATGCGGVCVGTAGHEIVDLAVGR